MYNCMHIFTKLLLNNQEIFSIEYKINFTNLYFGHTDFFLQFLFQSWLRTC